MEVFCGLSLQSFICNIVVVLKIALSLDYLPDTFGVKDVSNQTFWSIFLMTVELIPK